MTQQDVEIWVVDDDESVRRSLSRLLRAAGFGVETFASAEEFFSRGDYKTCRCLVVDICMPGANGLELLDMLVASGDPIPVVIITAHYDPDIEHRALEKGSVAFLLKPFDEQALLHAVAAALASRAPCRPDIDQELEP